MAFDIFDDIIGAPLELIGIEPNELPFIGGFFGNPQEEALQQQLAQNAQRMQALAPQMAEGRMQGLRQQLAALGPANNMLAAMYGPGAAIDLAALGQNPLPSSVFEPQQPVQAGPASGSNLWMGAFPAAAPLGLLG